MGVISLESAQRELLTVLLNRVFEQGLISEFTYQSVRNSLASMIDFPELLQYPVCLTKEGTTDGGTQGSG